MYSWWLASVIVHSVILYGDALGSYKGHNDFYTYFITEAPKHKANYKMDNSPAKIPWLRKDLLDKGKAFYETNFLGNIGALMWSLEEVLAMKTFSSVPVATGTLLTERKAYHRMLKTLLHVDVWCLAGSKMFDRKSEAEKSFITIRRRHQSAAHVAKETDRSLSGIASLDKKMIERNPKKDQKKLEQLLVAFKADLAFVDTSESPLHLLGWNSSNPVGQFDIGVAQFILYCHSVMIPKIFGILRASEADLEAYVHMWAVIGRKLGLEDRFNVALNLEPKDHERFYRNIIVAGLKTIDVHNINFMSISMEALSKHFPIPILLQLRCWMYYVLTKTLTGFRGENILRQLDTKDRACLILLPIYAGPHNLSKKINIFGTNTFRKWFMKELIANSIKD